MDTLFLEIETILVLPIFLIERLLIFTFIIIISFSSSSSATTYLKNYVPSDSGYLFVTALEYLSSR